MHFVEQRTGATPVQSLAKQQNHRGVAALARRRVPPRVRLPRRRRVLLLLLPSCERLRPLRIRSANTTRASVVLALGCDGAECRCGATELETTELSKRPGA